MILVALTVSSCATRNVAVLTSPAYSIDVRLLEKCLGPVNVPKRDLTKLEVVQFYNTNRDRLVACSKKHSELVAQVKRFEELSKDVR